MESCRAPLEARRTVIMECTCCHFVFSNNHLSAETLCKTWRRWSLGFICSSSFVCMCVRSIDCCTVYEMHLQSNLRLWRRQSGFSWRRRQDKDHTAPTLKVEQGIRDYNFKDDGWSPWLKVWMKKKGQCGLRVGSSVAPTPNSNANLIASSSSRCVQVTFGWRGSKVKADSICISGISFFCIRHATSSKRLRFAAAVVFFSCVSDCCSFPHFSAEGVNQPLWVEKSELHRFNQ